MAIVIDCEMSAYRKSRNNYWRAENLAISSQSDDNKNFDKYLICQFRVPSQWRCACTNPGENVGENTRTICENYALFSRAISSDRAHFSPFRRLFSRISRARAVTCAIR